MSTVTGLPVADDMAEIEAAFAERRCGRAGSRGPCKIPLPAGHPEIRACPQHRTAEDENFLEGYKEGSVHAYLVMKHREASRRAVTEATDVSLDGIAASLERLERLIAPAPRTDEPGDVPFSSFFPPVPVLDVLRRMTDEDRLRIKELQDALAEAEKFKGNLTGALQRERRNGHVPDASTLAKAVADLLRQPDPELARQMDLMQSDLRTARVFIAWYVSERGWTITAQEWEQAVKRSERLQWLQGPDGASLRAVLLPEGK